MNKQLLNAAGLIIGFSIMTPAANATLVFYNGPQTVNNATGLATIDFQSSGNTFTALINNTSPTTLNDGTGVNSPGITAFGFKLSGEGILISWSLTAFDTDGIQQTIGSSNSADITITSGKWILSQDSNVDGLNLEWAPNTDKGVKGALYNPSATAGFGSDPWFTAALLTLNFSGNPTLDTSVIDMGSGLDGFSYVRMQNVGAGGTGSLKLTGGFIPSSTGDCSPTDPNCGNSVPEPGPLSLLAIGLLGLGAKKRRKRV
jgi:hypothetical protein